MRHATACLEGIASLSRSQARGIVRNDRSNLSLRGTEPWSVPWIIKAVTWSQTCHSSPALQAVAWRIKTLS